MSPRQRLGLEVALASFAVTGGVTLVSALVPAEYVATVVASVFLGATWVLVWRKEDEAVEKSGLTLGGLMMPGPLQVPPMARSTGAAVLWALLLAAIVFFPFFVGWKFWWRPATSFHMPNLRGLASDAFAQVILIALPEEAFYRGYLQSRIEEMWPPRWAFAGARVGGALLLTSAIFALGHLATIPNVARLAVFFPSLLFGWLRSRTGGIGAATVFHAMCNIFSEFLGRSYGIY
jgi:membrane protease YdiL (CAAX protease family)